MHFKRPKPFLSPSPEAINQEGTDRPLTDSTQPEASGSADWVHQRVPRSTGRLRERGVVVPVTRAGYQQPNQLTITDATLPQARIVGGGGKFCSRDAGQCRRQPAFNRPPAMPSLGKRGWWEILYCRRLTKIRGGHWCSQVTMSIQIDPSFSVAYPRQLLYFPINVRYHHQYAHRM